MEELGPVVLCRSLWDAKGTRLAAVTVYHSVFC
jgi:diphthine-ammonia ligase